MGAEVFVSFAEGATAGAAFQKAVDHAAWDHGHSGYTGTIAEKPGFRQVTEKEIFPDGMDGLNHAEIEDGLYTAATQSEGKFWDDKWGDAACLQVGERGYYFFGWASS